LSGLCLCNLSMTNVFVFLTEIEVTNKEKTEIKTRVPR